MNRSARILLSALALVLLVAGSALANRANRPAEQPQVVAQDPEEGGEALSEQVLDKIVERLGDAGVETDAATVADLAATYGVGGAVRILAWGAATDADVAGMFDGGMGWGEIAQQLNDEDAEGDLALRPGIGWVMGGGQGNAHGLDNAPGQAKKQQ